MNAMESEGYEDREALVRENQDLRHQLNLLTSKQGEANMPEVNNLKRENDGLKKGYNQISELLEQKDLEIKNCESLMQQKDDLIRYLKDQLSKYMDSKNQEFQKVMEGNKILILSLFHHLISISYLLSPISHLLSPISYLLLLILYP